MTPLSRRTRLLAPALTIALAAGFVGMMAAPASAVRTAFSNNGGVAIADPISATNAGSITINDDSSATPYPSTINVVESGVIADVIVTLSSLDHNWPEDIDIVLVGPTGQQATLMSDAGGFDDLINKTLVFDDEAAASLPQGAAITGTTYRPTNYGIGDPMPGAAPDDNGNSALSVFDDTQAQGAWSLYVVDDEGGIAGDISSGWSLRIAVKSVPYPSQVTVSGVGTKLSDLNLNLGGVTHTNPDEVDILLVGPAGQAATVMSDAGGGTDLVAVNLVLDDEAVAVLPDSTAITSGNYRPGNYGTGDEFAKPAPEDTPNSALSVFDGTNPNGTWNLYIMDDSAGDQGTVANWSLDVETDNTPPTGTIVVNGGAATVGSNSVTLNLAASDPGTPTSAVTLMRFSNDGVTFSAYQPYAATAAWLLAVGDGAKTVYAQFRDASGNESAVVSDTITLDVNGPKAQKLTPKKNAKGVKTTTKVKIKASEALKKSTVTKKNVFLKEKGVSGKIKAEVKYNAAKKLIVLTPVDDLDGGTTYKVTVKGVQDAVGHKWDEKPKKSGAQPLKYSFKTA